MHLQSYEMSVDHFWRSPVTISFWKDWPKRAILLSYIPWRFRWSMTCRGFIEDSATMHVFERAPLKVWRNLKDRTTSFPAKATGWNKCHLNRFDSVIFSFFFSLTSVKLPGKNIKGGKFEWESIVVFVTNERLPVLWQCIQVFEKIKLSSSISNSINSTPYCFWLRTLDY